MHFGGHARNFTARFRRSLSNFRKSCDGAVAVLFAVAALPIMGMSGSALDYAMASRTKAHIDAVADIAALAGVKISSTVPTATAAQVNAVNSFNGNLVSGPRVTLTSLNVTVSDNGLLRTAVVTYTAKVQTSFMGLFGISNMEIGGTARASSNLPTYIDFFLLLDNSPSMGIGATPSDVATMVANTSDQCGFACHDLSDPVGNYYKLAKKLKVTMRIDVVRQATQQLM